MVTTGAGGEIEEQVESCGLLSGGQGTGLCGTRRQWLNASHKAPAGGWS